MAGAGHGWIAPVFVSMPLVLLYPAVFVRAFASETRTIKPEVGLLVIGAALDLLLLIDAVGEGGYISAIGDVAGGVLALWIGLWAGWQALAYYALVKRARAQV